ncbi:MAG: NAD(P)-dependent alcohol dehydrogenase [Pseudomonadales bacterium]|nr:NAD(P)-dependent alcohol dehydrogenase [Pseudomonadales bacterium]
MINALAILEPGGKLEPFRYDPGELSTHDVEIAVSHCGICHSDLSMIDNEWGRSQYPLVPGHEVVGTISALGSNVKNLSLGQNVGLGWQSSYCNHCSLCMNGDHNLCREAQPTIVGRHGGFADKVRADATSVVPIPDGIALDTAGPMFCAGSTVFNPLVEYEIKPTAKVGVIGIGGLGHLALKFLNAWGCEVTAFTSSESKASEASALGAHNTINSRDPEQIKQAKDRFDFILSTVNVKLDWNLYLTTLSPRGRLHFVGITLEPLDIAVFSMLGSLRSVSASPVSSPATMSRMLEFARRHNIQPSVEKFRFDDANDAVDRLRSGEAHYRVVLER